MTDFLDFEANLDDSEVADAFDDFTYWSSMFGQLLFRHLPLSTPITVLDVGCGTGFPLLELADRLGPSSTVRGIDSWEQAVGRARRKARVRGNGTVQVDLGDAAHMPYEDESFDLIVSNLGINNFESPPLVVAECHRVCRPGGRLALTSNLAGHMREFYGIFEETLIETQRPHLVEALREQEAHRSTIEGLRELLVGAGFEISSCCEEIFVLRYADGSAFLRAYLTRVGFLDGWRGILVDDPDTTAIFEDLEGRLNLESERRGGLHLSIPAVYVEGSRPG